MDAFPHHYTVTANGNASESQVSVSRDGLQDIMTDAPAAFGGPGDKWSPEDLIMAAVADCFVLSFRAISQASKVEWTAISCKATGTLDRVDRKNLFTAIELHVSLSAPEGSQEDKLARLLQKSEESCLITNSMTAPISLATDIRIG
jgi:organic hydroperoxide reductase OsmC/OhrA